MILCGTPIGNLDDATFRLVKTLESADVIACEDVSRIRKLLSHFGIPAPTLAVYNEGNERRAATQLVREIADGKAVALVSDAGMPGMSDPGYRLVRACVEEGLPVDVVPGPTSVVSALVVSGLPSDRFVFEGWLSKKPGERADRISQVAAERRTLVFFCSPHRIKADLTALLEGLGDRDAALVRELTKLHEEVRRGLLSVLLDGVVARAPKGEMVLVVAGAGAGGAEGKAEPIGAEELALRARRLMDGGIPRKDALAQVAQAAGVRKRDVFDALVEIERDDARRERLDPD